MIGSKFEVSVFKEARRFRTVTSKILNTTRRVFRLLRFSREERLFKYFSVCMYVSSHVNVTCFHLILNCVYVSSHVNVT